jgi:hypothetical protein
LSLIQLARKFLQLLSVNPAIVESDLVRRAYELPLPMLQHAHKFGRLEKRIVRSRIKPRKAASEPFEGKPSSVHIREIEVSDLQFSALRRPEARNQINHLFVVEIKADCGPAGFWNLRLFFYRENFTILVELNNT